MTDKEVITDGLSCSNCHEKARCEEQKERKNSIIDIHLQDIKNTANACGCDLAIQIEKLRQTLPNITRCDVVLEKQLQRKEQECEQLKEDLRIGTHCIQCQKALENCRLQSENEELKKEISTLKTVSIMIDNNKYKQALEEIKEITKFAQSLPCGNPSNCNECTDEITNNGQFCMQKRIDDIKNKINEVLK